LKYSFPQEANEKLMEQERAKNRAETELAAVMVEKLQMEEEKNKQLIAQAVNSYSLTLYTCT